MAKPKSRPQLCLEQARYADDLGGIPKDHWCYLFFDNIFLSFNDAEFADLYEEGGQHPISPRLLMCMWILQFMFSQPDRGAIEQAISSRHWRIALGIEPGFEGFCHTVLVRFRQRIMASDKQRLAFDRVIERVKAAGLIKQHHQVRIDSTALHANVALLSRADLISETIRLVLRDLLRRCPQMQQNLLFLGLYEQYGQEVWLGKDPVTNGRLVQLGRDAKQLLRLCGEQPVRHKCLLARVLDENFVFADDGEPIPKAQADLPPDHLVSPHDPDVEVGKKGDELWNGDKAQIAETVAPGETGFIVDATTTGPRVPDAVELPELAQRVAFANPQIDTMIADQGYASAANTKCAAALGLDLISPPRANYTKNIFPATAFTYDFIRRIATCPAGQESHPWAVIRNKIRARFARPVCRSCALRNQCTTSKDQERTLTLPLDFEQLCQDRKRAQELGFADLYRQRAGIEATISELVRCYGMRRSRYRGFKKRQAHLLMAATALNVRRLLRCLASRDTRTSNDCSVFLLLSARLNRGLPVLSQAILGPLC